MPKPEPKTDDTPQRFVAKQKIYVGNFLAHNVGDEVPADNVERNEWQDFVKADGS